jgi:hypothetical protein
MIVCEEIQKTLYTICDPGRNIMSDSRIPNRKELVKSIEDPPVVKALFWQHCGRSHPWNNLSVPHLPLTGVYIYTNGEPEIIRRLLKQEDQYQITDRRSIQVQ